ncbi:MAG TPA: twin-arginine translocase TatA/TatE family subunit [Pyrinomonadaceae bacterium]|jgi:TatA/E family protein of Tat protein translocase|nr:twin-arginine translocase TatA/TatE family subunit [Pyrinomonadaceae bacterium]
MVLLFLESVGTTELLLILVAALVLFGPRKLPELSRSIGKSLNEFKRASDEFKRTWEREANLDSYERERRVGEAMPPPDEARAGEPSEVNMIAPPPAAADSDEGAQAIARVGAGYVDAPAQSLAHAGGEADGAGAPAPQSPHKTDWL